MFVDLVNWYFYDFKIMLVSVFFSCKFIKIDEINLILDFDICKIKLSLKFVKRLIVFF